VRRTLREPGTHRSTFYAWYHRHAEHGYHHGEKGVAANLSYRWSEEFLEAGKRRLLGNGRTRRGIEGVGNLIIPKSYVDYCELAE
jgi:hypothetical protein